ncbi:hypothetical protein M3Y95_00888400 [Aphelenchoides besseyi]|nr:hypothetical protein M3Y95_00888400 [Aphelenchoides besseyi]
MLISNSLNIPANGRYDHYGIGYYTEPETQRLYFYASYYSDRIDSKKWKIYRVAVDQVPLVWEFVGDMNIVMNNVCISPCGRHLWSLEIDWLPRRVEQSRVFFRQVNIRTLEFEDFKTPVLPFNEVTNDMRSAHYQHTIHGTFLFVHVYQENFEMHKVIDEIFLMGIDQVKRQVHFKLIELPKLPTGDFYHVNERFYNNVHGKWSTGIIELYDSLYFYRIDYFGSLYVLNWQPSGPSDWTKFSVTGDYRPATLIKSDKQDLDAAAEGFTPEWINCINHLTNSRRFYLQNGIVHEDIYETKSSMLGNSSNT